MFRRTVGDRLVMSPMVPLVAGAAAAASARHLQQLSRSGYRQFVVVLSGVPLMLDDAGIEPVAWEHTRRERA